MLDQSDPRRVTQMDIQVIAQEAKYLNELEPSQRLRLTVAGSRVEFPGQSPIISEGSQIDDVYMVLRGMVTVGLYQGTSPSLWLYHSGRGTVVDMSVLLDPPVSPVSINALTDVEVLAIPREVMIDVLYENPAVACKVLRNLASRMALINRVVLKELTEESPGPSLN